MLVFWPFSREKKNGKNSEKCIEYGKSLQPDQINHNVYYMHLTTAYGCQTWRCNIFKAENLTQFLKELSCIYKAEIQKELMVESKTSKH